MSVVECPWTAEREAADRKLKEILDNMATLNDLFGGNNGAPFYPLQQKGDAVVGVITEEPKTDVPVYDFNTKKPKYFVEVTPGTWKVLPEGQFDKDSQNHRPVHKIVVTLQTAEGKTFRIDSMIQTGKKFGMQLLDDHLWSLYSRGMISAEEMIDKSKNPADLTDKVHRIGRTVGRIEWDEEVDASGSKE